MQKTKKVKKAKQVRQAKECIHNLPSFACLLCDTPENKFRRTIDKDRYWGIDCERSLL